MASTREIRRRIRSVKNIAKVTKAMETVAAAKMRKAQQQVLATRPYAEKSWEVLTHLARLGSEAAPDQPLLKQRPVEKVGLLDERFQFYGEDMDLALRACLAGFHCCAHERNRPSPACPRTLAFSLMPMRDFFTRGRAAVKRSPQVRFERWFYVPDRQCKKHLRLPVYLRRDTAPHLHRNRSAAAPSCAGECYAASACLYAAAGAHAARRSG
jgi:hypothetical protein